ncbi:MAG: hypothetical protein IPO63_01170 [Bacteroidetes bacterium]|nr:hypothetical protein [Bacteroidota bacterium]
MNSAELRNSQEASFQLFRLPKEKIVLDFVVQKLGEGASPERYEILESVLDMYRTSTGFDPFALSKGRFKRLKAAEFRASLFELDKEIGQLISSDEYKQFIAEKSNFTPLFKEYVELGQAIQIHPALSLTSELESFEAKCENAESEEILLCLYRQQTHFLEVVHQGDGIEKFIEKYDTLVERQSQRQREVRLGFELIRLEQSADKGQQQEEQVVKVYEELGVLLTLASSTLNKYQLLLKIIRASLLTASPYRYLATYLDYLQSSHQEILLFLPEAKRKIFTVLAQYSVSSSKEQRLAWLDAAELEAKHQELHDERPGFRFIRCIIESDAGKIDAAIKCLNEAEHLIYKASTRSLSSRNNWIRLSEYRSLLFALKVLQGETIPTERFLQLQQLAEDMGRHRQEISVLLLEWKGLQHYIFNDLEQALTCFDRAKSYRKNKGEHPWEIFDKYFCSKLSKSKKKSESAQYALLLREMKEPFYSAIMGEIIELIESKKATKAIVE